MVCFRPGWAAGWLLVAVLPGTARAQASASRADAATPVAQQTIGHLDVSATAEKVQVCGAVTLTGEGTALGNGSTVTAGKATLPIHLTRGGHLDLCATTTVHLSQQYNAADADSPLMVALDHGAIEAHYKLGKNSDVVLTPDLRILLSGPGQADVRIRLNEAGDTCVANEGNNAPYVTVSEQMGPGVYRVMPNQRVMFEQGSVRNVVDNEAQPCGCPATAPVISVASAGSTAAPGKPVAKPGEAVAGKSKEKPAEKSEPLGGPSSTPADTAFPLAESEGLAPPPAAPTQPVVPPGETHSEVTTTLSYTAPKQTVPTGTPNGMATPESAATVASAPAAGFGPSVNTGPVAVAEAPPAPEPKPKSGFFHKLGRFFAKIFG